MKRRRKRAMPVINLSIIDTFRSIVTTPVSITDVPASASSCNAAYSIY